jgi:hypothetical protein
MSSMLPVFFYFYAMLNAVSLNVVMLNDILLKVSMAHVVILCSHVQNV